MEPTYTPPNYQVFRLLGSGQTSYVYRAGHPQKGEVALKLPRPELHEQPVLRRMFENEVQFTLNLKHPNIVGALDGHPTGERAFLALELCPGGTLDQRLLERGQLPLELAYKLILDVAKGLEHAHTRQILHRDVKPANVFLVSEDEAKLGDFGTGLYLTEKSAERVGTAFYMAPEIFQGHNATVQSDVYSLGILAYEVIACERPFMGDTQERLMMAHLSGLPKNLRHHRPELSSDVNNVVKTAMSRDENKRFRTVREFIRAFSKAAGLNPETPSVPQVGRASRVKQTQGEVSEGVAEEVKQSRFGWFKRKK